MKEGGPFPTRPIQRRNCLLRRLLASLQAVVHLELDRMRGHPEACDFLFLERYVGIEHPVRKHTAASQKLAVTIEAFERFFERSTWVRHFRSLLGLEIVEVLVERIAGMDLVLHPVESGHKHCRE